MFLLFLNQLYSMKLDLWLYILNKVIIYKIERIKNKSLLVIWLYNDKKQQKNINS